MTTPCLCSGLAMARRFRWGSVSMFNTFDPPALAANDTWPFTVSYTCWTGYFINLFMLNNWPILGETLLLTPQRGSVADLSPSGLHVGDALLVLDQGLTQAVFQPAHRAGRRRSRRGQAVLFWPHRQLPRRDRHLGFLRRPGAQAAPAPGAAAHLDCRRQPGPGGRQAIPCTTR